MPNFPTQSTRPPWIAKRHTATPAATYHSERWRKYRAAFLRQRPLCTQCEQPATVVDHIHPASSRPDLFWRADNHQPLCERCHNQKRATQD